MPPEGLNDAVRSELRRVAASQAFRSSERLRRFLEYLVVESLEGRASFIKEYSVGLHVFDKPDSFDPKIDSTVRSEASKLRTKLRLYYETEGREDPIQISVPRGSYVAMWEARQATPERPPPNRPFRYRMPLAGALLLIVLAAASSAGWRFLRRTTDQQLVPNEPPLRRLTDDLLSFHPSLSKEGNLLVYASDRAGRGDLDLWLQPASSKQAIRLTEEPVDEFEPTISPDGAFIAYRSERQGGGVYVIPALGGKPRLLAQGGQRPRFSPDGSHIAYSVSNDRFYLNVKGSGTAYVTPLNGGLPREVAPNFASSHFPIYSPDGSRIFFLGHNGEPGNRDAFDWWMVPAGGGEPVRTGIRPLLDQLHFRGPEYNRPPLLEAWAGNDAIFGARLKDETNLWRLPLMDGKPQGNPQRLTLGATVGMQPSVSLAGKVVFSTAIPNAEIVALPLRAEQGVATGPLQAVAPSPAADHWPSVTRDGKRVVFFSSMRERSALYLADAATAGVSELLAIPNLRPWSEISRDGNSIVYHASGEKGYDAWEQKIAARDLGVEQIAPTRLCTMCQFMGWTRDRRTMLYSNLAEPVHVMRRDTVSGVASSYIRWDRGNLYQPMLSPDERWVAFSARLGLQHSRIWLAPWADQPNVPEQEWIPVTDGLSHDTAPVWSPEGRVLYFASNKDGFTCLYGQRIREQRGGLDGPPFPVRHLHSAAERTANLGVSFRGFGVAANKLVLRLERRAGNIWLIDQK